MSALGRWKRGALDAAGNLALGALARAHARSLADAAAGQERLFRALRDRLAGTAAGRDIRLERYASHRQFIRDFPPRGYEFYEGYVKRIMEGEPGVLYADRTEYFLATSGTSGFNSKIIPCNAAQRRLIENCQRRALATLIGQSRGLALASDRFAYGTRAGGETVNGIPKDYISGIVPQLIPRPLREYVVPSAGALAERDWAAKVRRIAAEARHRDVRGIFGVPAHLLNVLRDVAAEWGVESLRETWPNLETCVYSGTSVQPFRHSLDRLAGGPLHYFGAYVATEGPLGFEMPGPAADPARMAFVPDLALYSFRDVDAPEGTPLALDELKEGGEYLVHLGMPNGFLHYAIRDWIKVARTRPFVQFELMGRIDAVLNAATEKTSEAQLSRAVHLLQERTGLRLAHYFVHPGEDEDGMPRYEWTLAAEGCPETAGLARAIDEALMESAPDYRETRLDTAALVPPVVRVVAAAEVREHLGRRLNGPGQFKMRHAFGSAGEFCRYWQAQGGGPLSEGRASPPQEVGR